MTKIFLVVYAKARNGYSGLAPDVPGCISAAYTLEEMRAMLSEALEGHFESMMEHGETLPEPATTNVEFKDEDFEGVEYFVVEHLEVRIPANDHKREALSA